ncbi:hypothetical protein [Desulfohalobium retbaense]|uniref:hypothetical protein n=1 Tax=Desulfohalobium retbaense TaxID=45663 RepID=UPI001427ACDB|nr:hypothetical protein [Desulfohalobium retbaense]
MSTSCWTRTRSRSESGAVLVLSLIVLAVLSILIAGFGQDTKVDLFLSRNLRLKNIAHNWGEAGLDVTREVIAHAGDTRGGDANATFPIVIDGETFNVENPGDTLFWGNGTVLLSDAEDTLRARSRVRFQGTQQQEGNSIIIAAGYEGIGKGAGSGGALALIYSIQTNSTAPDSNARQRMAEIYRFAFGGM